MRTQLEMLPLLGMLPRPGRPGPVRQLCRAGSSVGPVVLVLAKIAVLLVCVVRFGVGRGLGLPQEIGLPVMAATTLAWLSRPVILPSRLITAYSVSGSWAR